jgi:hypothetical protein
MDFLGRGHALHPPSFFYTPEKVKNQIKAISFVYMV